MLACIAAVVVMGSTGYGYVEGDIYQSRSATGAPPRFLFPFDLGKVEITRPARSLVEGLTYPVRDNTQDAWWKWWPFWQGVYDEVPVIDHLLDLHRRGEWDHPMSLLNDGQRAWNHNVVAARRYTTGDPVDHPDPARRAQQPAASWIHRPIIGKWGRGDEVLWYVTIPDAGTTTVSTIPPFDTATTAVTFDAAKHRQT
jgi:hypothetical protein